MTRKGRMRFSANVSSAAEITVGVAIDVRPNPAGPALARLHQLAEADGMSLPEWMYYEIVRHEQKISAVARYFADAAREDAVAHAIRIMDHAWGDEGPFSDTWSEPPNVRTKKQFRSAVRAWVDEWRAEVDERGDRFGELNVERAIKSGEAALAGDGRECRHLRDEVWRDWRPDEFVKVGGRWRERSLAECVSDLVPDEEQQANAEETFSQQKEPSPPADASSRDAAQTAPARRSQRTKTR